jgi:hypothetical protein
MGRPAGGERLAAGWAALGRVAGGVGERLAGLGRRGLRSVRELDERVGEDPARRERSAMLVVAAIAGVVLLGIIVLVIVVGTGGHASAPATRRVVGSRPPATPGVTARQTVPPGAPASTTPPSPTVPAGAALQVLHSGKCLAVPGNTTQAGVQLVQRSCDGDPSEQFHLLAVPGRVRTFSLVDSLTSRCVDVQGASGDDGAPVIQWECTGAPNQQFELRELPGLAGHVQLVALHSGKCVDVDPSTADGAPVRQASCLSPDAAQTTTNQSWRLLG